MSNSNKFYRAVNICRVISQIQYLYFGGVSYSGDHDDDKAIQ
jgi:hypothetical protein